MLIELEARLDRMVHDRRHDMACAWAAGALPRAKALPKLDKFLGPDPTAAKRRERKPKGDGGKAKVMAWARLFGSREADT